MTRKTPSHHRHDQHVGDAAESPDHHSADPQAITQVIPLLTTKAGSGEPTP